jgi:hypothetical protein
MIKKVLSSALRKSRSGARLLTVRSLVLNGYLKDKGWMDSVAQSMPVDGSGQPIPWYTYGAIDFLSDRIRDDMSVFEFGSGNSTLWWSSRTRRVVSCEHDEHWYALMKSRVPANVTYAHVALDADGAYASTAVRQAEKFDVIVIDGRDRVNCTKASLAALKPDGSIVFDNSDRSDYESGYAHLQANGFRRLDFWGMGPINSYGWCTSVFYRTRNCFGI